LLFYLFGFSNSYGQKSIYVVDTVESQVLWFCGNHFGCVNLESGYISLLNGKISSGSFIIDMNSIYDDDITENNLLRITLDNIIKSDQFFNTEEYPTSIFTILKVEKTDSLKYHVTGNLKIKDRAKDIEFDSNIKILEDRFLVSTNIINIDRTEWGINSLSEKFDPEDKEKMHVPDTISFIIYMYANKLQKKYFR